MPFLVTVSFVMTGGKGRDASQRGGLPSLPRQCEFPFPLLFLPCLLRHHTYRHISLLESPPSGYCLLCPVQPSLGPGRPETSIDPLGGGWRDLKACVGTICYFCLGSNFLISNTFKLQITKINFT